MKMHFLSLNLYAHTYCMYLFQIFAWVARHLNSLDQERGLIWKWLLEISIPCWSESYLLIVLNTRSCGMCSEGLEQQWEVWYNVEGSGPRCLCQWKLLKRLKSHWPNGHTLLYHAFILTLHWHLSLTAYKYISVRYYLLEVDTEFLFVIPLNPLIYKHRDNITVHVWFLFFSKSCH